MEYLFSFGNWEFEAVKREGATLDVRAYLKDGVVVEHRRKVFCFRLYKGIAMNGVQTQRANVVEPGLVEAVQGKYDAMMVTVEDMALDKMYMRKKKMKAERARKRKARERKIEKRRALSA